MLIFLAIGSFRSGIIEYSVNIRMKLLLFLHNWSPAFVMRKKNVVDILSMRWCLSSTLSLGSAHDKLIIKLNKHTYNYIIKITTTMQIIIPAGEQSGAKGDRG